MSDDDIRHVGIYGYMNIPFFEITDFEMNKNQGIGFLPGQPQSRYDAFPDVGIVIIDENEYEYAAYTGYHVPRGPFQIRNFYDWSLTYDTDGNYSGWAVELTWFRYSGIAHDAYINSLAVISTGHGWLVDGTAWKPRRKSSGSWVWVDGDRSRWYSEKISKFTIGSQSKAYITPCLYELSMVKGENIYHVGGTTCQLKTNDEIICKEFSASGGYRDITLGSILTSLCAYAGATASFPGNYEVASYTLTTPGTSYEI